MPELDSHFMAGTRTMCTWLQNLKPNSLKKNYNSFADALRSSEHCRNLLDHLKPTAIKRARRCPGLLGFGVRLSALALLLFLVQQVHYIAPVQKFGELRIGDRTILAKSMVAARHVQHLLQVSDLQPRRLLVAARKFALLDHQMLQLQLLGGPPQEMAFHSVGGDHAVHDHGLRLPNPVHSVLRLQVRLWVPVRVVDDHRVGGHEVDAQPPRTRAEEEEEEVWVGVEGLDAGLSVLLGDPAIDAAVPEPGGVEVVLQQVQEARHLREDQALVACLLQHGQHLVEQRELAALCDQGLVVLLAVRRVVEVQVLDLPRDRLHDLPLLAVWRAVTEVELLHDFLHHLLGLGPHHEGVEGLEQERVVADLPQLHHCVEDAGWPGPFLGLHQILEGLCADGVVPLQLLRSCAAVEHDLSLGGQVQSDVLLQAPQHEGPHDVVQFADHLVLLLRMDDVLCGGVVVHVVEVEPRLEGVQIVKNFRQNKIQEGPQLAQVVLQGGAGDQQTIGGVQPLQLTDELAFEVLQPMGLVHHQILPFHGGEELDVIDGNVI
mmetsp:Transcript_56160/g.93276  ORF Transcript_56160/g.93276 Transcript_56160/m.93276 type:complete len:546 (+) Transcript_56160:1406-3043(+)